MKNMWKNCYTTILLWPPTNSSAKISASFTGFRICRSLKMCKKFFAHFWGRGGGARECAKLACLVKLYTTPPFILTLVTWVPQGRLAFGHSARRLAVGPPVLGQTKFLSVQPRLLLVATIGPAGGLRVFFYWVRPASFMVWPDFTAPSCPTVLFTTTFTLVE